jgi:hypothetical protein
LSDVAPCRTDEREIVQILVSLLSVSLPGNVSAYMRERFDWQSVCSVRHYAEMEEDRELTIAWKVDITSIQVNHFAPDAAPDILIYFREIFLRSYEIFLCACG